MPRSFDDEIPSDSATTCTIANFSSSSPKDEQCYRGNFEDELRAFKKILCAFALRILFPEADSERGTFVHFAIC
jgi:hypothetical protein